MPDTDSKDLEWNIGKHRIQYIGKKTVQVREKFDKAVKHPTRGRVRDYFNTLQTLYFDIRQYIDSEETRKQLDDKIEELEKSEDIHNKLDEVKEVDKTVQDERLDLGLDIPSKTSPDNMLD